MDSTIIKCPQCGNSLLHTFQKCHLCGADTSRVVRAAAPTRAKYVDPNKPRWVDGAYVAVSLYFILSGVIEIVIAFATAKGGDLPYFAMVSSVISILFGIGLLARVEIVRGIANFLCAVRMIFAVLGGISSFVIMMVFPALGILALVMNVLSFCLNGLMIYLIGETD